MEKHFFTLTEEEAEIRLDRVLKGRYPEHSRSYFQYLIEQGSVTANGKAVKKGIRRKAGEEIELFFLHSPELSVKAEKIPLDIIFEDDHIIVINKPAGMVVHPAPGHPNGTLVNGLLGHCELGGDEPLRPGIVHRLDKDTSGVILCAKTCEAHRKLIEQFMQRQIQKKYIAVTVGNPGEQTVCAPIGRHRLRRKEMCVCEDGREAITHIKTLNYDEKRALVEARPVTGRTHQIRVHLKHVKCPIVGDTVYGTPSKEVNRHQLHAHTLAFFHPISGEQMTFSAPIPKDFLWTNS